MSLGSDCTTSAVAPPERNVVPPRLLSPAASTSIAPPVNRTVTASPLKSRNLALRSSEIDGDGLSGASVQNS